MSSDNQSIENVKVNELKSDTQNYRIKSYVVFLIVILLIFIFLVFLGRIGNDVFGIMMFSVIFIVPVLILLRNKLSTLLPEFIRKSLFEIDDSLNEQPIYNLDKKTMEYGYLFTMIVLLIGAVVLIADYRDKINDPSTFLKIMLSLICLILAGIMLSHITGEELSISGVEDEELKIENENE